MSTTDINGLRAQCAANAKVLLQACRSPSADASSTLPSADTSATLVTSTPHVVQSPAPSVYHGDVDVVVFGSDAYTAAVMVGLTPVIEGGAGTSPEVALRKLLMATCELLNTYMPKVGSHQRNIHGGGVFDEDAISSDLIGAQKRTV